MALLLILLSVKLFEGVSAVFMASYFCSTAASPSSPVEWLLDVYRLILYPEEASQTMGYSLYFARKRAVFYGGLKISCQELEHLKLGVFQDNFQVS
jgi:hypothetical protein